MLPRKVHEVPAEIVGHWEDVAASPSGTKVEFSERFGNEINLSDSILIQNLSASGIKVCLEQPATGRGVLVRGGNDFGVNVALPDITVYGDPSQKFNLTVARKL